MRECGTIVVAEPGMSLDAGSADFRAAAAMRVYNGQLPQQHVSTTHLTQPTAREMLVSLTVGKVDAGVAVLLTEDKRLVRAPHPLPRCTAGASLCCTRY
jgi:hypothetical protein